MYQKKITLKSLLLRFVGSLLILLLLGNFFLNISITRDYLQNQLQSHAQDAATSLGLALSSAIDAKDQVLAGRMIDAIFDSGDYHEIRLTDLQGKELIGRRQPVQVESVPDWFISLLQLATPVREAQVMSGWNQLGVLAVESHPGYAYMELWRVLKTQLIWFGIVVTVGFGFARIFISAILKPLKSLEHQAHEMSHNHFNYRAPMPNTRELVKVALAMNEMADKLGLVFSEQLGLIESLREQSFLDALTGLSNREGFDQRLRADLESKQAVSQGSLVLIQLKEFDTVNQSHGRATGDEILVAVAGVITELLRQQKASFGARRSGADFSVFLPGVTSDTIDEVVTKLMAKFSSLHALKRLLRDDALHIGVACASANDNHKNLLSKADMALRQAQGKGVSGWQRYTQVDTSSVPDEVRQASDWLAILQNVLAQKSLQLHIQPVFDRTQQNTLYHQVLARIELNGQLLAAGVFLPMVERFTLSVPFDQMVVSKVLDLLANGIDPGSYCISLSERSLVDEPFLTWLDNQMTGSKNIATQLIFEVPEYTINHNEPDLVKLCGLSKKHGFGVSIERFGVSSVPFSYLQRVAINAIKIDHSFVREVNNSLDNQFFLRSAIQIAHSQSIQVIAVGVESEQEWDTLCELGVDGALGYYLGRPAPFV